MELVINSKTFGEHVIHYDKCDHDLLSKYTWHISHFGGRFYAYTMIRKRGGKQSALSMSRLIMDYPVLHVDHINNNPLDNRRCNLRLVTNQQNRHNSKSHIDSNTPFKGVSFHKASKKFRVAIHKNGKQIHGGLFADPKEAAKKYNQLAVEHFGEFAYLNNLNIIQNGNEKINSTHSDLQKSK